MGGSLQIWREAKAEFCGTVPVFRRTLVTEFYSFDALYREIKSDETDIRQNVTAALDKARTVKRLLEQWPEAKELLPAEDAVVPPPPAIRREALNEMIGLPTEPVQE